MTSRSWSSISGQISDGSKEFIRDLKFRKMSPVQAVAIPLFLSNKDVLVEACTGSGKTLAFLIPAVELCLKAMKEDENENSNDKQTGHNTSNKQTGNRLGALILAPTRELANQIHDVLAKYITFLDGKIRHGLFVGGKADRIQPKTDSKKQDLIIAVGTPGRLAHILDEKDKKTRDLDLKSLEILVFDEADRLLELGFEKDISQIVPKLPKQRRTGLFSATLNAHALHKLVGFARNPVQVKVTNAIVAKKTEKEIVEGEDADSKAEDSNPNSDKTTVPETLKNYYLELEADKKLPEMVRVLKKELGDNENQKQNNDKKIIIFFLTCACVDFYHRALLETNVRSEKIHGQMDQKARDKNYKKFLTGESKVLLATDVVARGVDIPNVDLILQYDPPNDPAAYIHRIGRTARAGNNGRSLLFLMPNESTYIHFLKNRGVNLREFPQFTLSKTNNEEIPKELSLFTKLRKLTETDRAFMTKGINAFVSYVRGYQEHQLQYIFTLEELPLGDIARSMALLRIPRMKEILGKKLKGTFEQSNIHPDDVPFMDKQREKQRQERLAKEKEKKDAEKKVRNDAKDKKRRDQDKISKGLKKEQKEKERTRTEKRKAGRKNRLAEWKVLQIEEGLAKKMKKGKITQKEFDVQLKKELKKAMKEIGALKGDDQEDSDVEGNWGNFSSDSEDSDSDSSDAPDHNSDKKQTTDDNSSDDSDNDSNIGSDTKKKIDKKGDKKRRRDDSDEDSDMDSDHSSSISEERPKKKIKAMPMKKKRRVIKKKNR